ncbi:DUF2000 domain-containing protein [Marinactinospora thermotolerans]|uniref:DUF2000 domain-containing protein n=1 Tax=Marinactinospora thermotolerans DSM 45154 TaxID=1122192 RepID=A0A1T4SNH4_9ACTN|nr:DUF2000 domain-containing protein [Marinactinospora thermotolerans]SKA29745.1 Protein of unknown function [Marinactinospora thermotolerans DSM 45154]
MSDQPVGFEAEEIRTGEETRNARLKWVIVVDAALPAGRAVNAGSCVASATAVNVAGLLAHEGVDADGSTHPGLPWAGCTILGADVVKLRQIRDKADRREDVFVADMPIAAQETRVYDEYVDTLATLPGGEIAYAAVSLVGPRKAVDRIVGGLKLLP